MNRYLRELFTENLSYKIVALLIAVILWVTILGRRDFVYTKNVDVEVKPQAGLVVATQTTDRVKVRVSGPRSALKKFMENPSLLILDLQDRGEGVHDIEIPSSRLDIPLGVRVLSIRPNVVRAEVVKEPARPPLEPTPPPAAGDSQ